jgi:hypothetical protein
MVDRLNEWAARLNQQAAMAATEQRLTDQPALPNGETARDPDAADRFEAGRTNALKRVVSLLAEYLANRLRFHAFWFGSLRIREITDFHR